MVSKKNIILVLDLKNGSNETYENYKDKQGNKCCKVNYLDDIKESRIFKSKDSEIQNKGNIQGV